MRSFSQPVPTHEASRRRRAFTLLELLVVIAIIFVLATIVIAALGGVRSQANRTESLNALRGMTAAYTTYTTDHKGRLMPGYVNASLLNTLDLVPRTAAGEYLDASLDPNDASSYVWRLAPYLDHEWKSMFTDYRSRQLVERLALETSGSVRFGCDERTAPVYGPGTATSEGCNDLGVSLIPSFGLNSIYLGGDNVHGGSDVTDRNPWSGGSDPTLAATRLSEVRNPARVIVFAPSVHFGEIDSASANDLFQAAPVSGVKFGYVELRPPWLRFPEDDTGGASIQQWHLEGKDLVADGNFSAQDATGRMIGGGIPIARWGADMLPLARVDGSTGMEDIQTLAGDREARNWAPFAVGYP